MLHAHATKGEHVPCATAVHDGLVTPARFGSFVLLRLMSGINLHDIPFYISHSHPCRCVSSLPLAKLLSNARQGAPTSPSQSSWKAAPEGNAPLTFILGYCESASSASMAKSMTTWHPSSRRSCCFWNRKHQTNLFSCTSTVPVESSRRVWPCTIPCNTFAPRCTRFVWDKPLVWGACCWLGVLRDVGSHCKFFQFGELNC
jgi:hypothetical protein